MTIRCAINGKLPLEYNGNEFELALDFIADYLYEDNIFVNFKRGGGRIYIFSGTSYKPLFTGYEDDTRSLQINEIFNSHPSDYIAAPFKKIDNYLFQEDPGKAIAHLMDVVATHNIIPDEHKLLENNEEKKIIWHGQYQKSINDIWHGKATYEKALTELWWNEPCLMRYASREGKFNVARKLEKTIKREYSFIKMGLQQKRNEQIVSPK